MEPPCEVQFFFGPHAKKPAPNGRELPQALTGVGDSEVSFKAPQNNNYQ